MTSTLILLVVFTFFIARAMPTHPQGLVDDRLQYLVKEINEELMPASRSRRSLMEDRKCGKKIFHFVQTVCGGACNLQRPIDVASYCCSQQCNRLDIQSMCCPEKASWSALLPHKF